MTERQVDDHDLPGYILSTNATTDQGVKNAGGFHARIVNVPRVKTIVDHVDNPFIIEYAIGESISALNDNLSGGFPGRYHARWKEDLDELQRIAFSARTTAAIDGVTRMIGSDTEYNSFKLDIYEACKFLKRVSRGSAIDERKQSIKQRARVLLDGKYCQNWTKLKLEMAGNG
jgi:hypothetical protein